MKKDFLVYGRKTILESIQNGKSYEKILINQNITGHFLKDIKLLCTQHNIALKKVPEIKLDKVTNRANHQGVVGFTSLIHYQKIQNIIPHVYENGWNPLVLILDSVTDVRNFGAIARSAEVFGCHAIVLPFRNTAAVNHEAIKASAGALLRLNICRERSLSNTIEFLRMSGLKILSSDLKSKTPIQEMNLNQPTAFIVGSEGEGVSKELIQLSDSSFIIPQIGFSDSLNVSVASGIVMYECIRQRSLSN